MLDNAYYNSLMTDQVRQKIQHQFCYVFNNTYPLAGLHLAKNDVLHRHSYSNIDSDL